jgi:hypothetical protein
VDTTDISPRFSGSYALTSDSKTIVQGSVGRFYDGILQGFSDAFASVPQQTNLKHFDWDGSQYVFTFEDIQDASTFKPDLDVTPRHMDEATVGLQHQLNNQLGIGARFIYRSWGNFIDDVRTFNDEGTIDRVVTNVDGERTYKGLELTFDKRLGNNWAATANYTWSQSRGNHFGDDFTALGDFVNDTCAQSTDSGLGTASGNTFVFPCSQLQSNLFGVATFDRPHMLKFLGSYHFPIGNFDLTTGFVGTAASKATYSKQRTVNVLVPGTSIAATTLTYFYEGRGSDRIDGVVFQGDFSVEATTAHAALGLRHEVRDVQSLQQRREDRGEQHVVVQRHDAGHLHDRAEQLRHRDEPQLVPRAADVPVHVPVPVLKGPQVPGPGPGSGAQDHARGLRETAAPFLFHGSPARAHHDLTPVSFVSILTSGFTDRC